MHNIHVSGYEIPTRLDKFLKHRYKQLNQALIERLLRKKFITVNGSKAESKTRIQDGDILEVHHVDLNSFVVPKSLPSLGAKELAEHILTEYKILETPDFIAINKPAGLASQGGSGIYLSIVDALSHISNEYRLVHRLDKETSGVFLIAKSRDAAIRLGQAFAEHLIRKKYIAILTSIPKALEGEIRSNIAKSNSKQYQKVEERTDGKLAITQYKILNSSAPIIVEFAPLTGRMHQLRYHAKQLGCPILGDTKYGDQNAIADRLFLHAIEIVIPASVFGQEYICKAKADFI